MTASRAYSYLVKIISSRDYSEHKLREKLREKKFPPEDCEAALNDIKSRGYLREDAYTEARIKGFMNKGYSINYVRQKLAQEHLTVSDEQIEEVFTEHRITEGSQIERLAQKKIGRKTDLDFDDQGKILRFLMTKGHNYAQSKKILKSLLAGEVLEDIHDDSFN